jgi:deoxyribodipyrimidine photolyase
MVQSSDLSHHSAFAPCAAAATFPESHIGDSRAGSQSARTPAAQVRRQPFASSSPAGAALLGPAGTVAALAATVTARLDTVAAPAAGFIVQPAQEACAPVLSSFGTPGAVPSRATVAWLQGAPRIDDNPALHEAIARGGPVVPVIVDDGNETIAGSAKGDAISGVVSANAKAIADLKASLQSRGSDLVVLPQQKSAVEIAESLLGLCLEVRAELIYMLEPTTDRQRTTQAHFSYLCRENGLTAVALWTGTLVDPEQLPFKLHDIPDNCDQFGEVLRKLDIPCPLPAPDAIPWLPEIMRRNQSEAHYLRSCRECELRGGETAALKIMEAFLAGNSLAILSNFDSETLDDSPSPSTRIATSLEVVQQFLDIGCISPRRLYHELSRKFGEHSPRRFCAELTLFLREHQFYVRLKSGITAPQLCSA